MSLLSDLFFLKADDLRLFISFGKLFSFGSSFPLIIPAYNSEGPMQISFYKVTETVNVSKCAKKVEAGSI